MNGLILRIPMTLIAIASSFALLNADEPTRLTRVAVTAEDVAEVTGLNIYKFKLPMKPGANFEIAISVEDARGAKPRILHRHTFTSKDNTNTVDLRLSFLPRDKSLRGVLLSQDGEIEYRVNCPNCMPSGISTIVSLPLNEIDGTEKILIPLTAETSPKLSDENETCLIAILATNDRAPASLEKSFPRAKISVKYLD